MAVSSLMVPLGTQAPGFTLPDTSGTMAGRDDGQAALDSLLGRLADIPTPAGATPRQLGASPAPTLLPIIDVRQGKSG